MDGWGANHDAANAVIEAKARARASGAPTIQDPPDGRLMRLTMGFVWSAVLVATVAAAVWAFGGSPTTIVGATIAAVAVGAPGAGAGLTAGVPCAPALAVKRKEAVPMRRRMGIFMEVVSVKLRDS